MTTGLLHKASDDQLRAVLAYGLSHQDLNHVAKAQVLGAGLGVGAAILDQIFPGTAAITPLAGAPAAERERLSETGAAGAPPPRVPLVVKHRRSAAGFGADTSLSYIWSRTGMERISSSRLKSPRRRHVT